MHIEELHLQNFRGFRELTLKLPSDVAVFIGINGSGKSSILDSIAILLSYFAPELLDKSEKNPEFDITVDDNVVNSRLYRTFDITEDDINTNSDKAHNAILVATGSEKKVWLEVTQNRFEDTKNKWTVEYKTSVKDSSKPLYSSSLSLPILAFYQTKRIVDNFSSVRNGNEKEEDITPKTFKRLYVYKTGFLKELNNFRDFFNWFKEEEEYENESRLRRDNSYRNPSLEIVRKALEKFLEGFPNTDFSDLHIVRVSSSQKNKNLRLISPSLVIKKNGQDLKLDQLSDGEKTLLILVVDIARRLAILNPSITNPSELLEKGTGIILIDEIDLHLHPQWQRIVIPSFRRTFPNCQFIVTTHSPQVLSGVNRENVLILEDSEVIEVTPHTFGRDSNSILSEVMGVEKRPIEMQEKIDKCFEMIDNDNLEEAKLKLRKLSELLGNNDPELVRAYTLIDFLNRVE